MASRRLAALSLAAVTCLAGCTTAVKVADGWTAHCFQVRVDDCAAIAERFVENLALSHDFVRHESGGIVRIHPLGPCTAIVDWADPAACWRADAPARTTRACMVIARSKPEAGATQYFGQVGGDDFSDRAGAPRAGTTPC